jgi:hypothetical protein
VRARLELDDKARLKLKLHMDRQAKELKARDEEIARLRAELDAYKRRSNEIEAVDRMRADEETLALATRFERARALRQLIDRLLARMRAICAAGGLPTQRQIEDLGSWYEELRELEALAIAKKREDVARDARSAYERAYQYLMMATRLRELDAVRTYEVRPGDTLKSIAGARLGDAARAHEILKANPGLEPDALRPGQRLRLPLAREEFEELRMLLAREADHDEAQPKRKRMPTGRVLETRGNIVAISIGSEDGVRVGDTYTVVRGKTYVGRLRVTKVYKGQSVAEFDAQYPGDGAPAATGDTVKLLDRR